MVSRLTFIAFTINYFFILFFCSRGGFYFGAERRRHEGLFIIRVVLEKNRRVEYTRRMEMVRAIEIEFKPVK